jgi:hypothetical protein
LNLRPAGPQPDCPSSATSTPRCHSTERPSAPPPWRLTVPVSAVVIAASVVLVAVADTGTQWIVALALSVADLAFFRIVQRRRLVIGDFEACRFAIADYLIVGCATLAVVAPLTVIFGSRQPGIVSAAIGAFVPALFAVSLRHLPGR